VSRAAEVIDVLKDPTELHWLMETLFSTSRRKAKEKPVVPKEIQSTSKD
jgi:hypothetical protein